jgi:TonB family protein
LAGRPFAPAKRSVFSPKLFYNARILAKGAPKRMHRKLFFLTLLVVNLSLVGAFGQTGEPGGGVPKTISGGVVNGKATNLPKPVYPAAAKAVRASGAVNVQVTIDETGNVISATAVSGHPLLRAAAVEAARQATFAPTMLSGQAVKVTGVIVYNFVPAIEPVNYEERMKIMAIGMILTMTDLEEFIVNDEMAALLEEVSVFSSELAPLKTLRSLSPEKRREVRDKSYEAFRSKLKTGESTEFEVGNLLSRIMIELGKLKKDESYRIDEIEVKNNLLRMKALLDSVEPDFPKEIMTQFRLLADFSEKQDFTSTENLKNLTNQAVQIFETIDPSTGK